MHCQICDKMCDNDIATYNYDTECMEFICSECHLEVDECYSGYDWDEVNLKDEESEGATI